VTFLAVADVGEGPGALGPPYFAKKKKKKITEGRKAGRASKTNRPHPSPTPS